MGYPRISGAGAYKKAMQSGRLVYQQRNKPHWQCDLDKTGWGYSVEFKDCGLYMFDFQKKGHLFFGWTAFGRNVTIDLSPKPMIITNQAMRTVQTSAIRTLPALCVLVRFKSVGDIQCQH